MSRGTKSKHLSVAFLDSTKDLLAFQQISRCGFEDCVPKNTFEESASHVEYNSHRSQPKAHGLEGLLTIFSKANPQYGYIKQMLECMCKWVYGIAWAYSSHPTSARGLLVGWLRFSCHSSHARGPTHISLTNSQKPASAPWSTNPGTYPFDAICGMWCLVGVQGNLGDANANASM